MSSAGNGAGSPLPSPEGVAALVRELAAVMQRSAVTELDLDLGALNLRLRRPIGTGEVASWVAEPVLVPAAPDEGVTHLITAPMVGTFYASPTPGGPTFVQPGEHVVAGQTIGIIEAMKIMNEITSERAGVVQEVLVENGQPVEYGSPLIRLGVGRDSRP